MKIKNESLLAAQAAYEKEMATANEIAVNIKVKMIEKAEFEK